MTPPLSALVRDGVLSIDNGFCEAEQRCAVYAYNIYAHRRVSAFEDPAQHFGKAFHAAMEWRYKNWGSEAMTKEMQLEMEKVVETAFEGVSIPEEEYRNVGRCKEVVAAYNDEYGLEPYEIVGTEQGLARELGYLRELKWCSGCKDILQHWDIVGDSDECRHCAATAELIQVIYQGRIDGIVRYGDKIMVRDFKTMKQIDNDREAAKWSMSGQLRGYCYLLSDPALGFGDVTSFWIDQVVVRPPASTARAKLPRNAFYREQHSCTKESIEEWRKDTLLRVENWLRSCLNPNGPPMSRSSCVWPRKCQFIDVCQLPTKAQRERWLQSSAFRENKFNPLSP